MEQIQCVLTAWKNKFCRDLLLCQTQGKKLPALSAWIVLTHIMAQSFPHCLVISLLTGAACAHQDWATPGNFSTAPTTAELPGSACAWLKKIKNLLWARTEMHWTSHSEDTTPQTADAAGTLIAYEQNLSFISKKTSHFDLYK